MVLYDLRCHHGHRAEVTLASMFSPNPACTICGAPTERIPGLARISGLATAGPAREDMPMSWRGIGNGDPATVRRWHRALTAREKLESKYPELAGDRRPVLAHEGQFAAKPLRAGDPQVAAVARAAFGTATPPVAASPAAGSAPAGSAAMSPRANQPQGNS